MAESSTTEEAARAPVSMRVIGPFLLMTLLWGSGWTIIRYQLGVVDPNWSVSYRLLIAAALMAGWALWKGIPLLVPRASIPFVVVLSAAQFLFGVIFVYRAEAYIASGLVAMMFGLLIIPNAILGRIFLHQRVSRGFIIGSALATLGMVLLFWPDITAVGDGGRTKTGLALAAVALLAASIGNVLQATSHAGRVPMLSLLISSTGLGALLTGAIAWATAGPPTIDMSAPYILSGIYLGIASGINYPIYMFVIREMGPARAAYSSVLTPTMAMGFSTLLEGYRWTPYAIGGSLLALAGLVFALRASSPAR